LDSNIVPFCNYNKICYISGWQTLFKWLLTYMWLKYILSAMWYGIKVLHVGLTCKHVSYDIKTNQSAFRWNPPPRETVQHVQRSWKLC